MKLPDNLPPLPPIPPGFDRWEYRGTAWRDQRKTVYATTNTEISGAPMADDWSLQATRPLGAKWLHYIEAVRERPTPLTDKEAMQTHGTPLAHYVRAEFARELERQRDAYAETLRMLRVECDDFIDERHPERMACAISSPLSRHDAPPRRVPSPALYPFQPTRP